MEKIKIEIIELGKLKIEVVDEDGTWFDITEWMYWFEENGVRDVNTMRGHCCEFGIRIYVDGEVVYESGV